MVLTASHITSLDIVVQSRVNLAIRYDGLHEGYKQEIFKFSLDQPPADGICEREGIDKWIVEYDYDYNLNSPAFAPACSSA
jgi:hypothetical protein